LISLIQYLGRTILTFDFFYSLFMIIKGLASIFPPLRIWSLRGYVMEKTPLPSRYYYSVWLRHLVKAYHAKLDTAPRVVAEFGPGDSLGVGFCALLSGADRYIALDVVKYSAIEHNLKILEELLDLFRKREPVPDNIEFPQIIPYLDSYDFPDYLFVNNRLNFLLSDKRIAQIRNALINAYSDFNSGIRIDFVVPWDKLDGSYESVADMIISQAVLEHVSNLSDAYENMNWLLKRDGYISHCIDFRSHALSKKWNGHWSYPDIVWKLIVGKRPFLLNREPISTHKRLLIKNDFSIILGEQTPASSEPSLKYRANKFKNLSNEDLTTMIWFVQAQKR
jgi:hypothetical protein